MFGASVSPIQASSNFSGWLTYLKIRDFPEFFKSSNADSVLILVFLLLLVVIWFPFIRSVSQKYLNKDFRFNFFQPISWELSGFIGCSKSGDEPPYISSFQMQGEAKRNSFIQSCSITSEVTGKEIEVLFKSDSGYVTASELNEIPTGAKIFAQALFYVPGKTGKREGIVEEQFLRDWGGLTLTIQYKKSSFKRSFDHHEVRKNIDRIKPPIRKPRPRVTAK